MTDPRKTPLWVFHCDTADDAMNFISPIKEIFG
jgi:hypothetical protein